VSVARQTKATRYSRYQSIESSRVPALEEIALKKVVIVVAVAALVFALTALGAPPAAKSGNAAQVARGKYLVENVGMCADCHSPRNERGEFIKEKWLHGAPLGFKMDASMPFADAAPALAGLPGVDDELAVQFMMGSREKLPARPPMPEYKLNRQDAVAVVKYLKSLKPPEIQQTAKSK
jgi:mono/diheme cytochrome c family protein